MIKDYFILALKNLKKRGLRSWLTLLGIFISIVAIISLTALGQGLQEAITGQFSTLDKDKLVLQNSGTGFGPPGSTTIKKLNNHDIEIIESIKGVKLVIPRLIRIAAIEYDNAIKFPYIADIPNDNEKIRVIYDSLNVKTEQGKLLTSSDSKKILVGYNIARDLFDKEIQVGAKLKIKDKQFEVAGILKSSSNFQLNSAILMLSKDLKELLEIGDETDLIVIQLEEKASPEEVAKAVEKELRKDRSLKQGEEDFSVQTPLQAIKAVNTILLAINLIVTAIAAISLLVGAIGIANTMYTSVLERTREIGIMKSIGAKNQDILIIFLIESGLFGLAGGILGSIAGLSIAFLIAYSANSSLGSQLFIISPSPYMLLFAISFSFLIGIISGVFPALQASTLSPIEALRK